MTLEEFQKRRTDIISKMLEHPDENGIYPTSIAFKELDELFGEVSRDALEKKGEVAHPQCPDCKATGWINGDLCDKCYGFGRLGYPRPDRTKERTIEVMSNILKCNGAYEPVSYNIMNNGGIYKPANSASPDSIADLFYWLYGALGCIIRQFVIHIDSRIVKFVVPHIPDVFGFEIIRIPDNLAPYQFFVCPGHCGMNLFEDSNWRQKFQFSPVHYSSVPAVFPGVEFSSVGNQGKEDVKPALFTTTDRKKITEGEEYFHVTLDWKIEPCIASLKDKFVWDNNWQMGSYSTREAAEQYILENKPVFSYYFVKNNPSMDFLKEYEKTMTKEHRDKWAIYNGEKRKK